MNSRLQEKVAKAMFDCATHDGTPWNEAPDTIRDWLLLRALPAMNVVAEDLQMFVDRNLKNEAAEVGKMLIERLRG